MSTLGIYFGPKVIAIVESKGKDIKNAVQMPVSAVSASELENNSSEQLKTVALFKEELRRNKIEAKEASLILSSKDLIVRNFELPILPNEEIKSAVNFEAKKYIPFKLEELVTDYQIKSDKRSKKNLVLFIGIKKESLEKYLSILEQLEIKPKIIEYSAFGVLRFLSLNKLDTKGVKGFISIDFDEEQEVDFTVLEDGFPLFSRGITFSGSSTDFGESQSIDAATVLEKLKSEIRISLDYYSRKFPSKKISQIFSLSTSKFDNELNALFQESGFSLTPVDITKILASNSKASNLSILKAYSTSIFKQIKSQIKPNLLLSWENFSSGKYEKASLEELSAGVKIESKTVVFALLICGLVFAYVMFNKLPLDRQLKNIISMRPKISAIDTQANLADLKNKQQEYINKLQKLSELVKKQFYLTPSLSSIPKIIPEGIWFQSFNFNNQANATELVLMGIIYLEDANKEVELLNQFLLSLKKEPAFSKNYDEIKIVSYNTQEIKGMKLTNFVISAIQPNKERGGNVTGRFNY